MIFRFLKDQIGYIITYIISFSLVLLFYTLSTEHTIEIIYPLSICIFVLSIFLVVKFIRYADFNGRLKKCNGKNANITSYYTEEQKEVIRVINSIEQYYIDEVNTIKSNNLKKNKFISQWIHNMKTPVSVIDLILQRMKLEKVTLEECINNIGEENTRLVNNLDQILDIFRLEEFNRDYVPEKVKLFDLVKSVINDKKNQFVYNKVYPKVDIAEDIIILTDLKWSKVMLEQIISNSIKYSSNENEIKSIYFTVFKDKDKIRLRIRDEGVGIPSYDINRIFEAFFTGENGRKFKNSSGIGLFVTKEICEKLNHEINVVSEVDHGTIVEISYLSIL
ncbi:MAG: sensor histidine kinase [Clostridium sp.]